MNVSTGVYRLAQVVKWGGRLLAVGGIGLGIALHGELVPVAVCVAIVWSCTAALAWVLEGFAKN